MCGYCNGPLLATGRGNFECPTCAPLLAEISTPAGWAAFQREASRRLCSPGQGKLL